MRQATGGYRGPDRRGSQAVPGSDYRGPDRRARSPLSLTRPDHRVAVLGCAFLLAAGFVVRAAVAGGDGLVVTFAALRDCAAGILVVSGCLLVVHWGLTGRAARAYDGVALLLVGGGLLTIGGPWAAWLHGHEVIAMLAPGTRIALGVPALVLLARSTQLVPVDASVRASHSLTNATATTLALLGIEALLRLTGPIDGLTGWTVAFIALAVGWVGVGAHRFVRPNPHAARNCERVIGAALITWGIGDIGLLLALAGNLRWGVAGAGVQLGGAALAAWAAVSLLLAQLGRDSERGLRLAGELAEVSSVLADEQAIRQSLLHDARNVVAAIRTATVTLERHADRLDAVTQAQLRDAVGVEFTKLQSLLEPVTPVSSRIRS